MQLSKSEEELMNILWKQKKAFMKDLLDAYDEPKPATTTIATLLKRMADKGFVAYKSLGRSREYFPLVKKIIFLNTSTDSSKIFLMIALVNLHHFSRKRLNLQKVNWKI